MNKSKFNYMGFLEQESQREQESKTALFLEQEQRARKKREGFGFSVSSYFPDMAINEKSCNGCLIIESKSQSITEQESQSQKEIYTAEISKAESQINLIKVLGLSYVRQKKSQSKREGIKKELISQVLGYFYASQIFIFKRADVTELLNNLKQKVRGRIVTAVLTELISQERIKPFIQQSNFKYKFRLKKLVTFDGYNKRLLEKVKKLKPTAQKVSLKYLPYKRLLLKNGYFRRVYHYNGINRVYTQSQSLIKKRAVKKTDYTEIVSFKPYKSQKLTSLNSFSIKRIPYKTEFIGYKILI